MITCNDCDHEGDGHEFAYFESQSEFTFKLQCPKCNSHNCSRDENKERKTQLNEGLVGSQSDSATSPQEERRWL